MSLFAFLTSNARFLTTGALLAFLSSFGQTFFIAIFAAQIMAAFDLTDGEWGGLYTVSTTASAIVMLWAGALTDRFRVRRLIWFVLPCLAATCVFMGLNQTLAGLFLVIFLLRFFGQGMTTQLSVTAMARWFSARRGLALSVSAMGFSIGLAFLPVAVAVLLTLMEWRWIWIGSAFLLVAMLPVLHWLLSKERTPSALAESAASTGMGGRHWTRAEVLTSPVFWLLLPMFLGPPAWGTALFFQQVHIAEVKGWPLVDYLALVPLMTFVSVVTTFVSGQMIDRFGSGLMARLYLLPLAATFMVMWAAESISMAAVAMILFGIGQGVQATLPAALWSEYYGTRHIGAIKAVSTSVMVLGSAIGPGVSGFLIDLGYSFPAQMPAIAAYFIVSMILAWVAVARVDRALATP